MSWKENASTCASPSAPSRPLRASSVPVALGSGLQGPAMMQNPDTREMTMARSVLPMIVCCLLTSCGSGGDDLMLMEQINREAELALLEECESRMSELEEEGTSRYFDIRKRVYRDVFRDHAEDLSRILKNNLSALPEIDLEDIERVCERKERIELPEEEDSPDIWRQVYLPAACWRSVTPALEEMGIGLGEPVPVPPVVMSRLNDEDDVLVVNTLGAYVLIPFEFDRRGFLRTDYEVTVYPKERD